jgi:hypothetical protein
MYKHYKKKYEHDVCITVFIHKYPVTTAAINVPAIANVRIVPKLRKKFRYVYINIYLDPLAIDMYIYVPITLFSS